MALVCPRKPCNAADSSSPDDIKTDYLVCASRSALVVGSVISSASSGPAGASVDPLQVASSPVVCLAFSPHGTLLAACTEDKTLRLWRVPSWELLGERVVPKRATCVQFSEDDRCVLVADKTGEVTSYEVSSISTDKGRHLLGHLSMILDMVLPPGNSHVITCDRDEKIRVSQYPKSYNIETYCLGHTDFVSALAISSQWPSILLSGGGDGTVRSWSWLTGNLLHTEQVDSHCKVKPKEPPVVTQLTCSRCSRETVIVVALESSTELLSFLLVSDDGKLVPNPDGVVSLAASPWSCAFDWSDCLWVCLPLEEEPLQCYRLERHKFVKVLCEDNPLLKGLCNWEYFKGCTTDLRDWSQLRKHTFDNMTAYIARKEERIRSKKAGKPLAAETEEGETRAAKVPKLETDNSSTPNTTGCS